ncbi:selenide, water dikinase SelD [Azospirillum sp. SYSU D00513]|uniref:selenide, water dikinase SelD n=1 Tax=Azospirillum sp. SYSU D00513 TaxID=2812561 RepID=UPI001A965E4C|nr:selenide, water dikinase SelD [Azospirillum sp. SYSU D00513]
MQSGFIERDLVLIGGGHAHVHVLKSFGMRPVPGVRLTLVARDVETPYSGMLPGFLAGHYRYDDCHIDLRNLARFAGARVLHAEAIGIDRAERRVRLLERPSIRYDLLSLDIGSTPGSGTVPGAADFTTPVKPVDRLAEQWEQLLKRVRTAGRPLDLAVVGGGAAGVELVLAMYHRLRDGPRQRFALVTRGELLPRFGSRVRAVFRRLLAERGIALHEGTEVVAAEAGRLLCADGSRIDFDEALWTTEASAAPWLRESGLVLDPAGFVAVDASLRSVSDPLVFAAGDVASVLPHPREKAGVFAVRQGPALTANLRRALAGEQPRPFVPQRRFLSIIAMGDQRAVAARGGLHTEGHWVWRWKDRIDRRFMRRFGDLPLLPRGMPGATVPFAGKDGARQAMEAQTIEAMRCGGCGAKVPAGPLARVLARLGTAPNSTHDDAAIVEPPTDGRLLVQTIDFFRSFLDDPYLLGRVAANHALGDIAAMGAEPLAALAIACVPPGADPVVEDELYQLLRGGQEVLEAAGARLVGGHSAEGGELAVGFSLTGAVSPARILRKGGLRPGDRLILTKPLGTGTLLAAAMRARAKARWITGAVKAMQTPPGPAAALLSRHGATACTDVTGFGLLGHLLEMLAASGPGPGDSAALPGAWLELDALPALEGALETLHAGVTSTLHPANAKAARSLDHADPAGLTALESHPAFGLLFDPQTAGGLLAGVPADCAEACVTALRMAGYSEATVIGGVMSEMGPELRVRLSGNAVSLARPTGEEASAGDGTRQLGFRPPE